MSLTTRQKGVGLAAAVVAAGLLTAGGIWMFSGGGQLVTYPIAPEAEALRNTAYRIEAPAAPWGVAGAGRVQRQNRSGFSAEQQR